MGALAEPVLTRSFGAIGRLWRTVRWLKAEQLVGRVRFRLQRPRPDLSAPPPVRPPQGPWVTPAQRAASLVAPTRWRLLAEEQDLDQVGWDNPALALLWRYNQHYFDDLNAQGGESRRDWQRMLVQRWCDENPPGRGTGWAPYPASLRIVNWIKWLQSGVPAEAAWVQSLAVQARWLTRRLEWHLLGNHLFANAKALVFAGLFFDGPEADRWLATGSALIERELPEQFLSDGAQFERSPMYHALALEDLLDLINIVQARAPVAARVRQLLPALRSRSAAALHWLRCLRHPAGTLARFNDCTEGIAPATSSLERYAAALDIVAAPAPGGAVQLLQPSGYARLCGRAAVALVDVAPIGPDYLPGHAHADTLSFELSIEGREVVVNRGTSVYGNGPRRRLERGTAAHSTAQLGGHDSSEVWSGFRVGRRARVVGLRADSTAVEAAHDGYRHLPGRPWHRRRWLWTPEGLRVEDWVTPLSRDAAVARYHLAPGLQARAEGSRWRVVDEAGLTVATALVAAGTATVEPWQHAVGFGVQAPAQTLVVLLDRYGNARVDWIW